MSQTPEQLKADTLYAFQMGLKGHKQFEWQSKVSGNWVKTDTITADKNHRIYHDIPEGWTRHNGEDWQGDKDAVIEEVMWCDGEIDKQPQVSLFKIHEPNNFTSDDPQYRIYAYKLADDQSPIPEDCWRSKRIRQLERELAAVTAERDEISLRREESALANEQMLADLSASQQRTQRLLTALEKCSTCLNWFAHNKPDDIGLDDQEAMELSAAALSSTPAVHKDTERLNYALEHSHWLRETFFMSTWQFEETKTRMREKIDAELAKEGK